MAFSLSFSGGGCRAAAHIGVLKALIENGLRPVAVSGTSAGAIVAALYSSGYTVSEMEDICLELKKHGRKLLDWNISGLILSAVPLSILKSSCASGVLHGKRLLSFLEILFEDKR